MLQSGGNAIPLGKRKASVAFEPAEDQGGSDVASDTDADEPLAGELDSDAFEIGSDEDSQMEAPDSDDDNNSGISSEEDMPTAAERQGAAARKAAVLLKVTQSAQPSSKQARKQLQHQQEQRVSTSVSKGDEDDSEGEQDGAEEAGAARRSSHEVRANGFSACSAIDPQHCNKAAFQDFRTTTSDNSSWSKHGSMWHANGFSVYSATDSQQCNKLHLESCRHEVRQQPMEQACQHVAC